MNLNDLNIICLETILEYLNFVDLLNAADSSTRLRHAARSVYKQKYSEMQLHTHKLKRDREYWEDWEDWRPSRPIDLIEIAKWDFVNFILIKHPKIALQLLRCFGHLVPSIFCFSHFYSHINRKLTELEYHFIDYINKFCSETLETLNIDCSDWNRTLDRFNKPFKKVEQLGITNLSICPISNTVPAIDCLIRLFPRMRSLEIALQCSPLVHDGCIVHHFPNMEDLKLFIRVIDGRNCDTCREVYRNIIRLNPQLKKLRFSNLNSLVADRIVDFSEYLQNLEYFKIELNSNSDDGTPHFNFDTLHLKRVKHLTAWSPFDCLAFDYINLMSFIKKLSFDHLESFTLQLATEPLAEQQFEDFCKKNQSIKKLKLIICPETVEPVLRINSWLLEALPLLEELDFALWYFAEGREIIHKTVTNILSTFKAIPKISFYFTCPSGTFFLHEEYSCKINRNFLNNFHDVWSTSWTDYKRRRLTFKRRNAQNN